VPSGHTFKAFPVQFSHFDADQMMLHISQNKIGSEVLHARGETVRHAVRVKLAIYPENVCAVWVMVAVRYRGSA